MLLNTWTIVRYPDSGFGECIGVFTLKKEKETCWPILERATQLCIQQHRSVLEVAIMVKGWHAAA